MNELLTRILAAHGGMNRWNGYEKVDATIVSGGGFFLPRPRRPPMAQSISLRLNDLCLCQTPLSGAGAHP
jgi:hypothetical protein